MRNPGLCDTCRRKQDCPRSPEERGEVQREEVMVCSSWESWAERVGEQSAALGEMLRRLGAAR